MSLRRWGAVLVVLVAINVAPPPVPSFELRGLTWSWSAPHAEWLARGTWRSGAASLLVNAQSAEGFHWEVHAPAGVVPPLRFHVDGAEHGFVRNDGALVLSAKGRALTESRLVAFQPKPDGTRRPLVARYEGLKQSAGGFDYALALDDVDLTLPVVVDPDVRVDFLTAPGSQAVVAVVAGSGTLTWLAVDNISTSRSSVQCFDEGRLIGEYELPSTARVVDMAGGDDLVYVLAQTTAQHGTVWGTGGATDSVIFKLETTCTLREAVTFGTSDGDQPTAIAVRTIDDRGPITADLVAVVGQTTGTDLYRSATSATPDRQDGFVVIGSVDLASWPTGVQGWFLGGEGADSLGFASWSGTRLWVSGNTTSPTLDVLNALQEAPRPGEVDELFFASFDVGGGLASLSYFGGDANEKPLGLLGTESGAVALLGSSAAPMPLSRPFSVVGGGFAAFVSSDGTRLAASTRFPLEGDVGAARARNDVLALASGADKFFPVRAAYEPTPHGGSELVASTWDMERGRIVYGSWFGGAQSESNPTSGTSPDSTRWLVAGSTDSEDFSSGSRARADPDAVVIALSDSYDGGAVVKPLINGTVDQCTPVLVDIPADWNRLDRAVLTRTSTGDTFSDPECLVPTGGVVVPKGELQAPFFVRSRQPDRMQVHTFTALGAPLADEWIDVSTPQNGKGMRLPLGLTFDVRQCVSLGTRESSEVIALDERGAFKGGIFSDNDCGTTSTGEASLLGDQPMIRVLQASGNGTTSATGLIAVAAIGVATQVKLVGPQRLVAGRCSGRQYAVLTDGNGPVTGTATGFRITGTGVETFADENCQVAASNLSFSTKDAVASFFVMGTRTGIATVETDGALGTVWSYEVVPASVDQLTFSGATTVNVGECARLDVESRDRHNNPSAEERPPEELRLGSTGIGEVSFFRDRRCTQAISGRPWSEGLWWVPVWIRGERSGVATVTASTGSVGSTNVTVTGGAPSTTLRLGTVPTVLTRGVCSSVTMVQAVSGSTPVVLNEDIALTSTDPALQFFSDSGCTASINKLTAPIGTAGANFYVKTLNSGTRTVRLDTASLLHTEYSVSSVAGPPAQLQVTPSPTSVMRDTCTTVSLRLRDAFGFDTNGTVGVSSTGTAPLTLGTTACGGVGSLSLTFSGSTLTLFITGAQLGAGTLTFTPPGLSAVTLNVDVTPPPVARWRFKLQPDGGAASFNAAAGACTPVDFEALDVSGRTTVSTVAAPLDGGSTSVFFHSPGDCDGGVIVAGPPSVPEAGARVWVRSTQVQTSQLAVGLAAQTGTAPFTVVAAAPARITAPASLAFEGRTCASLGPVTVQDAFGNPITSWPGGVSVSGTGTARAGLAADCSAAQSGFSLSSFPATLGVTATTAGTAQLRFDSADGGAPAALTTLNVGWPAAVAVELRDAGTTLVAGACGSGVLFALDDGGVPTRLLTALPLSADTTSAQLFANATCATPAATTLASVSETGASVGFSETRAGRTTFQLGPIAWPVDVDAGTPSRLAMNPVVFTAKTCPSPFELRVEDDWGNRSRTFAAVDVTTTGRNGVTVAAGAQCGTTGSALLMLNDVSSANVAVTALRAGDAGLHFAAMGLPAIDVPVTVLSGFNDAPVVTVPSFDVVVAEGDAGRADLSLFDLDWDTLTLQTVQLAGAPFTLAQLGPMQVDGDATGALVLLTQANGTITEDLTLEYAVLISDGVHVVDAGVRFRVLDTINEFPTARLDVLDAGPSPFRVSSGQSFTVSGVRSSDPNRLDTLSFAWAVDGGATPNTTSPELLVSAPPVGPAGSTVRVTLEVTDSRGAAHDTFVDVAVFASDTPVITSTPRTLGQRGTAWSYDFDGLPTATARLGAETLRWSLTVAPAGATIDALTGLITWTPSALGGDFVLRATTAWGWTEQAFTVTVLELPRITSMGATSARLLQPWLYDADGRAEGDNVTWWALGTHPTGMVIEGGTGRITWTPLVSRDEEVELIASNALGRDVQRFTVHVGDATTVLIADTANRQAQRGVGYVYDADRAVDVTPVGTPVRLISIIDHDTPMNVTDLDRFSVSPGGQVAWIPTRTGTFDVTLGAGLGTVATTYTFSIQVSEPSNEAPVALGTATPDNGPSAPFTTHLDGRASTAAPGRALVLWAWEAGDGTPPRYGAEVDVTYAEARGYTPRLEVADDLGNRASVSLHVGVGIDGVLPPEADIVVTSNEVLEQGKARVSFSCACRDPAGRPLTLSWDFGDHTSTDGEAPTHVYTRAASYWVTLVVSNGPLTTQVRKQVEVRDGEKRPPSVQAWAQPVFGRAPLTVKFTSAASDYDGVIATRMWDFGNGITAMADDTTRRFDTAGRYLVSFRGTDDDGLTSEDSVEIVVTGEADLAPPLFTSRPTSRTGTVGVAWQYDEDGRLAARGATRYGAGRERNGAVQGVPDGLTVDANTGLVTWTPKQPGAWPIVFWAENAAGRVFQVDLVVDVPAPPSGCGCAQVDVGAVVLLGLALLRRRRARV